MQGCQQVSPRKVLGGCGPLLESLVALRLHAMDCFPGSCRSQTSDLAPCKAPDGKVEKAPVSLPDWGRASSPQAPLMLPHLGASQ